MTLTHQIYEEERARAQQLREDQQKRKIQRLLNQLSQYKRTCKCGFGICTGNQSKKIFDRKILTDSGLNFSPFKDQHLIVTKCSALNQF